MGRRAKALRLSDVPLARNAAKRLWRVSLPTTTAKPYVMLLQLLELSFTHHVANGSARCAD